MINNEEIEESKKNKLQNQNQNQQVEEAEEPQKSNPKNKKEILSGIIPSTKKNMPIFEDPLDSTFRMPSSQRSRQIFLYLFITLRWLRANHCRYFRIH